MLENIELKLKSFSTRYMPTTNVVGFSRSIIALGTMLTLLINPVTTLFIKRDNGDFVISLLENSFISKFSIFYLFGHDYGSILFSKWLSIIILALVISGYLMKMTSILHWWVAFSFLNSSTIIDGGDQIASILTLFLIPICLLDNRKNHWNKKIERESVLNLISIFFLFLIKVQMAIIYFHAAVGKFSHIEWANGTALYYWLNHSFFGMPEYLSFTNNILTNSYFIILATFGVLIIEILLFLAIFSNSKYKIVMFYIAIPFHLLIIIYMGIFSFFFSMLGGLTLYLYPTNKNFKLCPKK